MSEACRPSLAPALAALPLASSASALAGPARAGTGFGLSHWWVALADAAPPPLPSSALDEAGCAASSSAVGWRAVAVRRQCGLGGGIPPMAWSGWCAIGWAFGVGGTCGQGKIATGRVPASGLFVMGASVTSTRRRAIISRNFHGEITRVWDRVGPGWVSVGVDGSGVRDGYGWVWVGLGGFGVGLGRVCRSSVSQMAVNRTLDIALEQQLHVYASFF